LIYDVSVRPAEPDEQALVAGLFQFYTYHFSQFEPPSSPRFEVDANGQFEAYPELASYWPSPGRTTAVDRWALVIRVGGRVAGFALLNQLSHRGGAVERNMAEMFVLAKYRRAGVASAAVVQIFDAHPGQWEVAIAQRNAPAIAFWPRVLANEPGVHQLREHAGDGVHWTGPIWSFRYQRP